MTVPSAGEFSSSLIPAIVLSQGTYHYAAEMIIDGSNPSMGEDVIFVMAGPSSNFSIKTLPADNVTAVGAVLNGEITIK